MSPDPKIIRLAEVLEKLLGPTGWLTGPDAVPYVRDWLDQYGVMPVGVARPATTAEVAQVVSSCRDAGIAVVPQGGRTGLCGGGVATDPGQVILSLSRMNRIGEIDRVGSTLEVEAGVVLSDLHASVDQADRMFPLYLGSQGSAQIGGLIACNAGGSQAFRFGTMRNQVLGLEVVLADGTVWSGMRPVLKDNAGFGLAGLFCGTEGSLGIVTRATLRLVPALNRRATALLAFDSYDAALAFSARLSSDAGDFLFALEFFDEIALGFLRRNLPDLVWPMAEAPPVSVLVELGCSSQLVPLDDILNKILETGFNDGTIQDGVVAASEQQRAALWSIREDIPEGQRREGPQVKNDISVPVAGLAEYIRTVRSEVAATYPGIRIAAFGHLADGNVHLNFSPPEKLGDFGGKESELRHLASRLAEEASGSFAAEHGVGRTKVFLADHLRSNAERKLVRRMKTILDPEGTFSPGVCIAAG